MTDIKKLHSAEYDLHDEKTRIYVARAPGRIHYLGDNGLTGRRFLLSSTIDRFMSVAVSRREDGIFKFYSADLQERKRISFANLKPRREDRWSNHVKLALEIFIKPEDPDYTQRCTGLSFTISGDIPQQSGFSSSSAIEAASALVLRSIFAPKMSDKELLEKLLLSRAAYYEKPNDNIDFYVMLKAKPDTFQVINEDKREIRFIKNPFDGYKLFIFDSRIPRLESSGELLRRDKQLLNGLEFLRQKKPTITFNDPRCRDLIETNESMNEETRRRCLHIVNELERLKLMESAIVANDYASSAKLFQHSQEDLRDLYEVSCPEVDWLVKRASETRGVVGSRMTGLGFAPCTFIIATDEGAAEFRAKLDDYERIFGFHPIDYEVAIAGPATVVK